LTDLSGCPSVRYFFIEQQAQEGKEGEESEGRKGKEKEKKRKVIR
jgi:hypothetical protein